MCATRVFSRKWGADDLSLGLGSYTYVDVNGLVRTVPSISAGYIPMPASAYGRYATGSTIYGVLDPLTQDVYELQTLTDGALYVGAVAPATTRACMFWADTTTGNLKQRDTTNASWIVLGTLDTAYLGLPTKAGIQAGSYTTGTSAVGTDAYAITLTPTLTALANGVKVTLIPDVSSVGAATLAVDATGAKTIKKSVGGVVIDLETGDMLAGYPAVLEWAATPDVWLLINPSVTVVSGKIAGDTVQVVNYQTGAVATGSTAIPGDDTIPQITEGDQYMTLAITPTSATNILIIEIVFNGLQSTGAGVSVALFKVGTNDALAATRNYVNSFNISFRHYMVAGGVAEMTFTVRAGGDSGTTTFNGGSGARIFGGVIASSITITEIQV